MIWLSVHGTLAVTGCIFHTVKVENMHMIYLQKLNCLEILGNSRLIMRDKFSRAFPKIFRYKEWLKAKKQEAKNNKEEEKNHDSKIVSGMRRKQP